MAKLVRLTGGKLDVLFSFAFYSTIRFDSTNLHNSWFVWELGCKKNPTARKEEKTHTIKNNQPRRACPWLGILKMVADTRRNWIAFPWRTHATLIIKRKKKLFLPKDEKYQKIFLFFFTRHWTLGRLNGSKQRDSLNMENSRKQKYRKNWSAFFLSLKNQSLDPHCCIFPTTWHSFSIFISLHVLPFFHHRIHTTYYTNNIQFFPA